MDITEFINSRDIRDYHREIGYEYNAVEAAWIVSQCNSKILEQKHEAWRWIIDNMPDLEVKDCGRWCSYFEEDSIHKILAEYMEMQDSFIEGFKDGSGGYLYTYKRYGPSTRCGGGNSCFEGFFSSWDKCISHIKETEDAEDAALCRISRRLPDETEDRMIHGSIDINISGEILSVFASCDKDQNERWYFLSTLFDELWFCFPVPFKHGDIVSLMSYYYPEDRDPIVIDSIIVPKNWEEDQYIRMRRDHGDTSDMNVWGYIVERESVSGYRGVYGEVWWNYMDVEYYRGELTGPSRALKPLSNWLKGELGDAPDLLLAGYHRIMMEEYISGIIPAFYTDEGLKLAGFQVDEKNGLDLIAENKTWI